MKALVLKLIHIKYKYAIRWFLFLSDPEKIHDRVMKLGIVLGKSSFAKNFLAFFLRYENKALEQNILGIKFKNPVGLAAGFDKNARLTQIIGSVGFGFEEVGSISGAPSKGNPKPRLWRLIKSKGIIVWNGLTNDGSKIISKNLSNLKFNVPIGINIVKTNSPQIIKIEDAIPDIEKAFTDLKNIGDYYTLNISCPNTEGEGLFYNTKNLETLFNKLSQLKINKPLFIKMPPDLSTKSIDEIIKISQKYKVAGFVLSNIVKHREIMQNFNEKELKKIDPGKGSISGKPAEKLSNDLIEYVYKKTQGKFIIIGCGGIFNAEDAYKKIRLGASLVQLITGMIFEGPQVISQINIGLVKLLQRDGFKNISEAIGADNK